MPTNRIELTDDEWTDLGAGPVHVHIGHLQNVRLNFGTVAPAIDSQDYIQLAGPIGRDYQGAERVFARAANGVANVVVVSEAA